MCNWVQSQRGILLRIFLAFVWGMPVVAYARDCTGLPTHFTGNEFPKGNFFSNFRNTCYLIPFSVGNGSGGEQGDLNSVYNKLYFNINPTLPPYQLIVLGEFPNSRYFSIGLYDDHSAITQSLTDVDIVPLKPGEINPYLPGVTFVSGQDYAVPINLGGTPGTLEKGCMMTGYNVDVNGMDGTARHQFMNWNLNTAFLKENNLPLHEVDTSEHTNPNTAGALIIRSYLDLTVSSATSEPHVIVRDVASGCAYPADYVLNTLNVVSNNATTGNAWQNQQQVQEHDSYSSWKAKECWGTIPSSKIQWRRGDEYTPGANPDASYLYAHVPAGLPQNLLNAGEVMRFRFKVPATPPTPCTDGCSRSGNEQMRYMSVSFEATGGITLASVPDSCPLNPIEPCIPMVQDADGNVTLVVGMGTPQPSWVIRANGYSWLDLSTASNYLQLNQLAIRNILPSSTFQCAGQFVPYKVGDATTGGGGLMGLYAPLIDFPVASQLPQHASPVPGPAACAVYPQGPPAALSGSNQTCAVLPPPPIAISTLTTQCSTPGCNQVVAQSQPPISILGRGFGSFPLGLPYTGNSSFFQITDTTQSWSAGYTGSACTVRVGEWSDSEISVVVNGSACSMVAGDQLTVTVWNPQTQSTAFSTITVQ
jgi:hypothetical protein